MHARATYNKKTYTAGKPTNRCMPGNCLLLRVGREEWGETISANWVHFLSELGCKCFVLYLIISSYYNIIAVNRREQCLKTKIYTESKAKVLIMKQFLSVLDLVPSRPVTSPSPQQVSSHGVGGAYPLFDLQESSDMTRCKSQFWCQGNGQSTFSLKQGRQLKLEGNDHRVASATPIKSGIRVGNRGKIKLPMLQNWSSRAASSLKCSQLPNLIHNIPKGTKWHKIAKRCKEGQAKGFLDSHLASFGGSRVGW